MKKSTTFAITALASAGFSASAFATDSHPTTKRSSSFLDNINNVFDTLIDQHEYTVAGHSSHQSHGSHASHSSHRSYYKPPEIEGLGDQTAALENPGAEFASERNVRSTPSNSVLPGSLAISKKLKILKGNTNKFRDIVTRAQLALIARGFEIGVIDGDLDAKTMAAVYKFQAANGLVPSGKLTAEVLTALNVPAR